MTLPLPTALLATVGDIEDQNVIHKEDAPNPSPDGHSIGEQYDTPSLLPPTSFSVLKKRIKHHYEVCSDYYYSLWGEHIHHGYFLYPGDTKDMAQIRLIDLLLEISGLRDGSTVLDIGCGIGGTSRYLARQRKCNVTGITISGQQVKIASDLTAKELVNGGENCAEHQPFQLGDGTVQYLELDAEKMGDFFGNEPNKATFEYIWISEAMSHLPDKELFFRNAKAFLNPGGKLIVADWFRSESLTEAQVEADIKPIEDGMLLPSLCTQHEYVRYAEKEGLSVFAKPIDISKEVSKTWDISWSLVQSPALWAFAFSQGRDGIAFLQAFRAMRRGYTNGTFRYAVMVFEK